MTNGDDDEKNLHTRVGEPVTEGTARATAATDRESSPPAVEHVVWLRDLAQQYWDDDTDDLAKLYAEDPVRWLMRFAGHVLLAAAERVAAATSRDAFEEATRLNLEIDRLRRPAAGGTLQEPETPYVPWRGVVYTEWPDWDSGEDGVLHLECGHIEPWPLHATPPTATKCRTCDPPTFRGQPWPRWPPSFVVPRAAPPERLR